MTGGSPEDLTASQPRLTGKPQIPVWNFMWKKNEVDGSWEATKTDLWPPHSRLTFGFYMQAQICTSTNTHIHTKKKTWKTMATAPGMSTIFLLLLPIVITIHVSLNRIGSLNPEYLKPKAEEELPILF